MVESIEDQYGSGKDEPPGPPIDAYAAWTATLLARDPARLSLLGKWPTNLAPPSELPALWQPVRIRVPSEIFGFFERVAAKSSPREPADIVIPPAQLYLAQQSIRVQGAMDMLVYARLSGNSFAVPFPDGTEILDAWPVMTQFELPFLGDDGTAHGMLFRDDNPLQKSPKPRECGKVMVGIVDDAIGFLNGRFMRPGGSQLASRFAAHWIQGNPPVSAPPGPLPSIAQLVGDLAQMSEAEIYHRLAALVYDDGVRHRMLHLETHGTHMLDLAAGADPFGGDPLHDVDLIGVQIPPWIYDDTSGKGLEPWLLDGLAFLGAIAFAHGAETLLVNASLGITAGPKDGTTAVERGISKFIADMDALGVKVKVLLPFGNSYEDQLAAELHLTPDPPGLIEWQVQPGDLTSGYFEIMRSDGNPIEAFPASGLKFGFTSPGGQTLDLTVPAVPGAQSDIDINGILHGRVSYQASVAGGRREHYVVAFSPSKAFPESNPASQALCDAGRWKLELSSGGVAMDLMIQMQRDDEPSGAVSGGRQAYFEGDNTRAFDARWREHSDLAPGGPVVYELSNSAYTEASDPNVISVAGALLRPRQIGGFEIEPARYASKGRDMPSPVTPDRSAVTETEFARPGVRGAGTFSNAISRLSGSSTASATALRRELETALNAPLASPVLQAPGEFARLGTDVVQRNRAFRNRP